MAVMEEAICEYLLSLPGVVAMIGSGANARLYPDVLPQGYIAAADGPAATYELIDSIEQHTLSDRCGLVQSRMQLTAFAATRKGANELARAMKNGGITTIKGVTHGVDIRGVEIVDGINHYEERPTDGSQEHRYLAEFDLMISYLED